ncbi:MAG: hypothetical protein GY836_09095, partial [Herbaspirillum sp.]|uniref:hypothetical protein n=1 Tax=Herbaspirillum sp. TaxID=1890675 RepID=UPI0025904F2D
AFEICPTLLKNIEWLIDNKIGEEVKKETPLKAGMIFTACNDKHLYGVQEDLRVIIIRNDYNRSSEGGHFSDDIHNVEDFERAYSCTLKFK